MDISDTRKCNLWNLEKLAPFLEADATVLKRYYQEILDDAAFLRAINDRLQTVRRDYGFTKGIFHRDSVDSADWFAFERILIYVLLRHSRPAACLETGVYYGGNTAFLLAALHRNNHGQLVSIDLPDSAIRRDGDKVDHSRHPLVGDSEFYDDALKPGFIIPDYLKERWAFVEGDSLKEIPKRSETFDFYMHDSDHSMRFLTDEIAAARPRLSSRALLVVDDIDWSNAFYKFCTEASLYPLLFTDNGKDNLRIRTGVVRLDHSWNSMPAVTGAVG